MSLSLRVLSSGSEDLKRRSEALEEEKRALTEAQRCPARDDANKKVEAEELARVVRNLINSGEIDGEGHGDPVGDGGGIWRTLGELEAKICERFGCLEGGWVELGLGPSLVATLSSEPSLRAALGPILTSLGGGGGGGGTNIESALTVIHAVAMARGISASESLKSRASFARTIQPSDFMW